MKSKVLKRGLLSSREINDRNRQKIVNLVEQGRLSIEEAVKKYCLKDRNVLIDWIRIYGTFDVEYIIPVKMKDPIYDFAEVRRLKELVATLQEENKRLRKEADDNQQRKLIIDAIIAVAKKDYNVDLSKKVLPELSKNISNIKETEE